MEDMAPELLQKIRSDFKQILNNDPEIKNAVSRINKGKATYKEVEDLSYRVGKDLSKALTGNIKEDILPNGHVPQNVAEKILHPVLKESHNMVIEAAVKAQEAMNKAAGIGLKAQAAEYDEEKAQGLAIKLTNGLFEETKWVLDEPVTSFVQNSADRTLQKNVEFQAHAGLKPMITREAEAKCCSWCADLEGTYDYGNEPKEIYSRHERCRCTVDYRPGNGKKQDVWSKTWHNDAEPEKIEERIRKSQEERRIQERKFLQGNIGMEFVKPIKNSDSEIQELNDFAKNLDVNIVRPDKLHGDIALAKEQIEMVAQYSKEYGIRPPSIRFEAMDPSQLGSASKSGLSIAINNNALRNRKITNEYLNSDNQLAATDIRGIAVHEMGHILCREYGDIGIEIARETLYNIRQEEVSDNDLLSFLLGNVSSYSVTDSETIPEVLSKNETNPDEFTTTFVKLLKERWGI